MSSILTNNGAMVALQTLKMVNSNLQDTQNQISTGKRVADASDNSAVYAISKVMESDVKGFEAISDSLSLGESTVATARNAAETVTDLLTDMKGRIVAAQEENVDRTAIQRDIDALEDQISSVVGAAQFNGLNLIDGSSTDAMSILSSLDRASDGTVTARNIEVDRQDLSLTTSATSQSFGTTDLTGAADATDRISATGVTEIHDDADPLATGVVATVSNAGTLDITIGEVVAGASYQISLDDLQINTADGGTATASRSFEYVASDTDGQADVAAALANQMTAFFDAATDSADGYTAAVGVGANGDNIITFSNGASGADVFVGLRAQDGGTPGSASQNAGLGAVATIDVTTDQGALNALTDIEALITTATTAAASFGSDEGRIQTQTTFVSNLTDSLKTGIGSMVDANMEEASARLQALQTQQQLAVQALSIANQAPSSIMQLFR